MKVFALEIMKINNVAWNFRSFISRLQFRCKIVSNFSYVIKPEKRIHWFLLCYFTFSLLRSFCSEKDFRVRVSKHKTSHHWRRMKLHKSTGQYVTFWHKDEWMETRNHWKKMEDAWCVWGTIFAHILSHFLNLLALITEHTRTKVYD